MGRRASREEAMKLIFQFEFQGEDKKEQLDYMVSEKKIKEQELEYLNDIIEGVDKNIILIDTLIEENSKGWKLNRLSKVDLSILRVAIYELKYREDIPVNVLINEAVEIAKKYSTKESSAFINGMLGKLCNLRDEPV